MLAKTSQNGDKMIETLFFLIFLHYLADFPLQGSYLAENKGKDDYLLFAHSFIWAGTLSVGLLYFGIFAMWKAVFLLAGHFVLDRLKARHNMCSLYTDQAYHFLQIAIVALPYNS
jgi:hypothetical protein